MMLYRWICVYSFTFFFLLSCSGGKSDDVYILENDEPLNPLKSVTRQYDYSGTGYGIDHVDTPETEVEDIELTYTIELGSSVKDIYFVFTNGSLANAANYPIVAQLFDTPPEAKYEAAQAEAKRLSEWARQNGVGLKGRPDISLFNSNPQLYSGRKLHASLLTSSFVGVPSEPVADIIGDTATFYPEANTLTTVSATCRQVYTNTNKTVNIWVADDSWTASCNKATCVTQAMVDELGTKFLVNGTSSNDDIYDWVSNIYGAEWGAQPFNNLIDPDNNITILLMDIDNDNSTAGGVVGFFWAKDNFKQPADDPKGLDYSNARIMFYLDSVKFADATGGTSDSVWEVGDYWPQILFGTLAHEFQHMIHFYQKNILNNIQSSATWINEMCSEVAEDFVASKVGIDGPRGVAYADGTAGSAGNAAGRLPRFNRFDYGPVAHWFSGSISDPGDTNVLNSYAINYSFGAFLARNYGGASLFQDIVQNNLSDYTAIETALGGDTFANALQKWGVGLVLSDDSTTTVPAGYRYNTGNFNTTSLNGINYDLGSINLYNYNYSPQSGPLIYNSLPPTDGMAGRYKTSNMYYRMGTGLTGTIEKTITLRKGTKMTAIVK